MPVMSLDVKITNFASWIDKTDIDDCKYKKILIYIPLNFCIEEKMKRACKTERERTRERANERERDTALQSLTS